MRAAFYNIMIARSIIIHISKFKDPYRYMVEIFSVSATEEFPKFLGKERFMLLPRAERSLIIFEVPTQWYALQEKLEDLVKMRNTHVCYF